MINYVKKLLTISVSLSIFVSSSLGTLIFASETAEKKEKIYYETNFKNKISSELLPMLEDKEAITPVYVWYKNITESEIENKVKDVINYGIDDLEVDYSNVSNDLIISLQTAGDLSSNSDSNALEDLKIKMSKHLDDTSEQREKEKTRTQKYLSTRKEVISEVYERKGNAVLKELGINESSIGYISKYAPVILAELTADEIKCASKNTEIENIALCDLEESKMLSIGANNRIKDVMGVSKINEHLNLTGSGVRLGIFDWSNIAESYCAANDIDFNRVTNVGNCWMFNEHGAYCAGVAAGEYGVAPEASIISASSRQYDSTLYNNDSFNTIANLESLLSANVDLINISLSYERSNFVSSMYSNFEKYIDCLIQQCKTIMVIASGNDQDAPIGSPGMAYNAVTVNGFHEELIGANQYNKVIDSYSYLDTYSNNSGCAKPDIIADSLNNGTSTSTAVVSGMIALLYQYKPSLAAHPDLTKAILQASCHEKVSESLYYGISSREGSGIPDMYKMISIVAQHSYGCGILDTNTTDIRMVQPPYNNSNMNISLAFMQSGNDNIADLDLKLYDDNSLLNSSVRFRSSTELIYRQISNISKYKIKIQNYNTNISNINYAYAWSTDEIKFYPIENNEGIYYLKNKSNNTYMTYDNANNRCIPANYTDNNNQSWIIKNINSNQYTIQNASGLSYGMIIGNTITGNYKHISEGNNTIPIYIENNNDNSCSFTCYISGVKYAMGIYQNYVAWYPYNSNNNSQKWYMESLQWKRGDVNMDGVINQTDVVLIRNHIMHSSEFTLNIEKYLADANMDNHIDLSDTTYINLGLC